MIPGVSAMQEVETNLDLLARDIPDALWRDLADAGLARTVGS